MTSNKPKAEEWDTARAWKTFEERIRNERAPDDWSKWEAASVSAQPPEQDGVPFSMKEEQSTMDKEKRLQEVRMFNENGGQDPGVALAGSNGRAASLRGSGSAGQTGRLVRRLRKWGAVAAAGAVLYGLLATSLGDRALAAMMQTFRIQHMVGIDLTGTDFSSLAQKLDQGGLNGQTLNLAQYGTISQTGGGPSRDVTPAEAAKLLGFPVPGTAAKLQYKPETTVNLKLNVDAVNRMIKLLGGTALLPKEADGKTITVDIPAGAYGTLTSGKDQGQMQIAKFGTPELTVEDGLDANAIRKAVLELPVLPESIRTKLAAIADWRNTLPVPNVQGVTENISLDGRDAVLGRQDHKRFLVWLDGGQITMLSGDSAAFPTDDAIIAKAKELLPQ
ncbi:hypothetical protein [Paenibacillus humicola]|uniref:hypothetical protein n=1 Tax=Paenibacillus humicola TaxID=3110540 RepID=UPI00237C1BB1|nr:hypothetical protein [Paenibacillus humicola]